MLMRFIGVLLQHATEGEHFQSAMSLEVEPGGRQHLAQPGVFSRMERSPM